VINNSEAWIKRADEVLGKSQLPSEMVQTAISMLTALYGPQSTQLQGFTAGLQMISKTALNPRNADVHAQLHAKGAIKNAKAELETGLIVSVRILVAGELLAELLRLGKEILEEQTEAAKNVAAVLVAAAFEDLMRRMGEEFASVVGRPTLQEVITALKNAAVLRGGQVGTAQSYLQFRNDSLHADWVKVDRSQIQSCIGFMEELLMKHFS
jgi:hypothetical protein